MHRSGTSVLTGVLGGLGLTLPRADDRWEPLPSNPEHYESRSMVDFDDRLLAQLGGSWDGPPDLPPGWEQRPELRALDEEARAIARRVYPGPGPAVWKDPRACLLLPYWRRHLPQPMAAVLMWRAPFEVAHSLRQRDGFSLALGTALWEHYNRAALAAVDGLPAFVTSYDELLDDPVTLGRSLADWLDTLAPLAPWRGTWDPTGGAAPVTESLHHQYPGSDEALGDGQALLVDQLRALHGPHQTLPTVALDPPCPMATALLAEHRELVLLGRSVEALHQAAHEAEARAERAVAAGLGAERAADEAARRTERAERAAAALRSTTSWRITGPLRHLSARWSSRRGAP